MAGVMQSAVTSIRAAVLLVLLAPCGAAAAKKAAPAGRICGQIQGVAVSVTEHSFTVERPVGARIAELARQRSGAGYLPWLFPCDDASIVTAPSLFSANGAGLRPHGAFPAA